jgi:hypothetical protein
VYPTVVTVIIVGTFDIVVKAHRHSSGGLAVTTATAMILTAPITVTVIVTAEKANLPLEE